MYEHGVAGTTTEDILQAAGVSNSQLYHYFADKAELTRAVIAYQIVDSGGSGREAAVQWDPRPAS
jgi:AcrR family transcriptional regulator